MTNSFGHGTGRDENGNPVSYERLNWQSENNILYSVEVRRAIEYAIRRTKNSGLGHVEDFYIEFGINEELGKSLHEVSDKIRVLERDMSFSNYVIDIFRKAEKLALERRAIEVGLVDLIEAFEVIGKG